MPSDDDQVSEALALPTDDTALKQAIKQAKREWIDLTDEEIETIIADHMGLVRTVSFAIEAGLKEKNRG
jgi:hypothetical protein